MNYGYYLTAISLSFILYAVVSFPLTFKNAKDSKHGAARSQYATPPGLQGGSHMMDVTRTEKPDVMRWKVGGGSAMARKEVYCTTIEKVGGKGSVAKRRAMAWVIGIGREANFYQH